MEESYFLQIKNSIRKIGKVLTLLIFLFNFELSAQSVIILTGQTLSKSKEKSRNSNFDNEYSNDSPLIVIKVNNFYKAKDIDFSYSFQYHHIWTRIKVDDYPINFFGYGASRISVFRNSLSFSYDVLHKYEKLSLSPSFNLSVDRFINRGFDRELGVKKQYAIIEKIQSPELYSTDFEGIIYLEVFDGWAFLPGIGVQAEWNFLWRFILSCNVDYSFGTREYQNFYFDHSYKGGPRQETKFTADGSLFSASVGIGFKLWNHKKSRKPE